MTTQEPLWSPVVAIPIPAIRDLVQFDLGPDLTLLAAENGRANQILVEAIAIALGFNGRRP
jgi:predicted ATPase